MLITTTKTAARDAAPGLTRVAAIYLLMALTFVVYWQGTAVLYDFWTSSYTLSYHHGFLIAAVTLWLTFRARHELSRAPASASRAGLAMLLGCSALWVFLWHASLQDPVLLLMPAMLWLAVFAAFGWPVARQLIFPFGYLYFAVPAWSSLTPLLQTITTHVVAVLASVGGIPTQVHGYLLTIPAGVFEVGTGCSGLHYLVVGLALTGLMGELEGASLRRRAALLLGMGALALFSNWVRVLVIVVAGQMTKMQHPLITKGHYTFGWAVFAICFLVFLWVTSRRAPRTKGASSAWMPAAAPVTLAAGAPGTLSFVPLAWVVLAIVAIPVISYGLSAVGRQQNEAAVSAEPVSIRGWSGPFAVSDPSWRPVFDGADLLRQVTYVDASGRTLEMAEVVYKVQRQGAELVGFGNSLTGRALESVSEQVIQSGSQQFTQTIAADRHGQRSVIWSAFDIGGRRLVHPFAAQLWYGAHSMVASPRSALRAYRVACAPTCEAAGLTLKDFVAGADASPSATR